MAAAHGAPGGRRAASDPWELDLEKREGAQPRDLPHSLPMVPWSLMYLESTWETACKNSRSESNTTSPLGQQVRDKRGRKHRGV